MGALEGGSWFSSVLAGASRLGGATLNFCEISGFGAVVLILDEVLNAKLNLDDVLDFVEGPVGGAIPLRGCALSMETSLLG